MYLVLLGVGAGFVLLSLIFGELVDLEGSIFSFLRPMVIAVFLTVMGGVGLILTPRIASPFVFGISVVSGLFVGCLLHRLVIVPLHKMQNTSAYNKQDLIGTTAKVALTIPQGGYGKIKYTVSGSVVTSPAKSADGGGINKDNDVTIMYIEDNTYFVKNCKL